MTDIKKASLDEVTTELVRLSKVDSMYTLTETDKQYLQLGAAAVVLLNSQDKAETILGDPREIIEEGPLQCL